MKSESIWKRFSVLIAVFALAAGCSQGGEGSEKAEGDKPGNKAPKAVSGDVVAKVGDSVITLADFEAQLNQQNPLIRARYKSLEQKKKLLENLVQREAMVQEAKRLGLDEDPEMQRGYKKILARHLVNKEFNQKRVKELEIKDEDIQRYYDENHDRYHAPEKVRVHQILIGAPKGDAAARKTARAKAEELLAQLKKNVNDRRLFLELARKHSTDEATRNVGGDTNFKTQAQLTEAYGPKFAEVAFGLKKANDLSGVVETDKGFYILRQSGRQSAIDLPLEKVKGQIRTTLFARARGEAYQRFVDEIKTKVGVQIFDDQVSKAKVDTSGGPGGRKAFPGHLQPGHRPPKGPALKPKSIRPLGKKAGARRPIPGGRVVPTAPPSK